MITEEMWAGAMLNSLKSKYSKCKDCILHGSRTCIVFGQGNEQANVFIVGSAPTSEDVDNNKVMYGSTGNILRRVLSLSGIDIKDTYMTNTVACKTPRDRLPRHNEIQACWSRLRLQLQAVKPKVIILMGLSAAFLCRIKNLEGNTGIIDKDCWPDLASDNFFGLKGIVLTTHPSNILRQIGKKKKEIALKQFLKDIKKAKKLLES